MQQQWWQEQNEKASEQTVAVSPESIVAPSGTDLWDELEAEARHRAQLEESAIVIEGNPGAFHRKRMKLAWAVIGFFCLLFFGMGLLTHTWVAFVAPLVFLLEGIFLSRLMKKFVEEKHSFIRISPLGLTAEIAQFRFGPVSWDEVEWIQSKSLLGMSYLKIKLKNPKATLNRALSMKNMPLKQFNNWALRLKPMEIMTQSFPISSKKIAEQIASVRPDKVKQ